jgi:heptosyltransferase-2
LKIKNYKKIAIINTAFIGDVALSVYLAETIKINHPNSQILFVTNPRAVSLLKIIKSIDEILVFDKRKEQKGLKGILQVSKQIKDFGAEIILSPHRSARSSLIARLSRPTISISYNVSALKFLYTNKVQYKHYQHEIERNLELLKPFDDIELPNSLPKINIEVPTEVSNKFNPLFASNNNNEKSVVCFAPGSIWKTKEWGTRKFIELANLLKQHSCRILLIGGEDDVEQCEKISSETQAINLAGKTNLAETVYILSKSALLVTNDSSPTHLATLVDCPCITIYGPTIPEFGFAPRSSRSAIIQVEVLSCKPCSIHGYQKCPLIHHKCMDLITSEEVYRKVLEFI